MTPDRLSALIRRLGPNEGIAMVSRELTTSLGRLPGDGTYWQVDEFDDSAIFFDQFGPGDIPPALWALQFELIFLRRILQDHADFDTRLPKGWNVASTADRLAAVHAELDQAEDDLTPRRLARIACFGVADELAALTATAYAGDDVMLEILQPADWGAKVAARR